MIGVTVMDRLEKIEKLCEEIYPEVKRHKSELELLKDVTSDLVIAVMEERLHIKRLRESIAQLERNAEKDREWMRKKWGEMAQRLGTLTEDIFAPGIPYLIKKLGYRAKERMLDVEYEKDGHCRQYDALVIAEDREGKEVLFVAEVKSQARSEDFEQLKTLLEDLFKFKPEYVNKKIIPILAAFRIPGDLINLANKRGVLLVRMGGEYLEPLNPEVVK